MPTREELKELGEGMQVPAAVLPCVREILARKGACLYASKLGGAGQGREMSEVVHNRRLPAIMPQRKEHKEFLLDQLMIHSYPGEGLQMSLSRLAMAAGWLGYEMLTPTVVFICYRKFKHELSERPYKK